MKITEKEKELCKYLMSYAQKKKCDGVRINLFRNENNAFEFRNGQLDRLESNSENNFYVDLFFEGRYGSFSSNRITKLDLELFLDNAINAVSMLTPDPAHTLPDPSRYYRGSGNLELYDDEYEKLGIAQKINLIKSSANEITQSDNIISITTYYEDMLGNLYTIASNGFENEKEKTSFHLSSSIVLSTDTEAKIHDSYNKSSTHWATLEKDGLTENVYNKAKARLNPEKLQSGEYDLITDNRSSGKFLYPIIGAISGPALSQKRSFLLDKRGEKLFGSNFSLYDRPHQIGKLGSRFYDIEGVATKDSDIIKNGTLCTYFLNTYFANKMNEEPTITGPAGVCMELGERDLMQMIADVQKGIWATSYNGGNVNPATGDFSFGIDGFFIENGEIKNPISEMNVTGNILDLWNKLKEIGNDPRQKISNQIPSLWFSDISFSGI